MICCKEVIKVCLRMHKLSNVGIVLGLGFRVLIKVGRVSFYSSRLEVSQV